MTVALCRDCVFSADVLGELSFSFFALVLSAASADLARSVSDDPIRGAADLSLCCVGSWFEPESCSFLTRHSSLIRSIARSVVNCLPAITSISRRPRLASFRSPATVMPPAGKACLTASSRRSGVSGPMLSWSTGMQRIHDYNGLHIRVHLVECLKCSEIAFSRSELRRQPISSKERRYRPVQLAHVLYGFVLRSRNDVFFTWMEGVHEHHSRME